MHSPQLLEHFHSPKNAGELPPPAVTVVVENPACGDILRLWAEAHDGRITRITFKARGCTAAIAAGSAATVWLEGRSLAEASMMQTADIERALGGLPEASKHAAVLAVDAVQALCRSAARGGT
jgi:nitrogen fixation NifU-like protein